MEDDRDEGHVPTSEPARVPTSLADRILGQNHVLQRTEVVDFADDQVKLEFHGLTVREVAQVQYYLDRLPNDRRGQLATAVYIVAGTYDPDTGERAFNESLYDAISDLPMRPVEAMTKAIFDLSGLQTVNLQQAVDAYLETLDDRSEGGDEKRAVALVSLRRAAGKEMTPTGEVLGA